jgi:hypothetical protein
MGIDHEVHVDDTHYLISHIDPNEPEDAEDGGDEKVIVEEAPEKTNFPSNP